MLTWLRRRWDRLGTLERSMEELKGAWDDKVAELARLEAKLAKREQRAGGRDLPPEQPLSGGEHPDLVRAARLRHFKMSRG